MKLSDWASIAEIVSGIAVVVTLIFLVLEVRQGNNVTRASMYASFVDSLIETRERRPPGTFRGVVGQQISFLYGLGIDHQGEAYSDDDGSRYLVKLIARRRI